MAQTLWHDPVDDKRGKKSRSRPKPPPKPEKVEDTRPILPDPTVVDATIVPGHKCPGCEFEVFDITHRAPKVLVWGAKPVDAMRCECVDCGLATWRQADPSILPEPTGGEYKFRDGVFRGKTVADVLDSPGGLDYISWCAANGKSPTAREACARYLKETKQ